MAIGSMFWTGYSREYRRLNPTASVDTISKPSTLAGFAGALFLVAFSMEFFGEGRDILPSALKALVMGLGVAGIMYLMYRKKK